MDNSQAQLIEKLQSSTNILVTVSRNPTVDQLAACLGATLLLNKLGKHATAVFSGRVPSTIEFLQPEHTIEKNTDSLRDFIIALDKTKADKLRYKVEDDLVRIFITPYRTSITQNDLVFSQGDFNVDLVLAIGVHAQEDLDDAITAHGRILHDAIVTSINLLPGENTLGSINWTDPSASSLAEQVASLATALGNNLLDQQIATALLTGIVAATERFSNEHTSPKTMSLSALLMSAGANQQLVASELATPEVLPELTVIEQAPPELDVQAATPPVEPLPEEPPKEPGTLEISHDEPVSELPPVFELPVVEPQDQPEQQPAGDNVFENNTDEPAATDNDSVEASQAAPEAVAQTDQPAAGLSLLDSIVPANQPAEQANEQTVPEQPTNEESAQDNEPASENKVSKPSKLITNPPTMGGMLTANTVPEHFDPAVNMLASSVASDSSTDSADSQITPVNTRGTNVTPLPPVEETSPQDSATAQPKPPAPQDEDVNGARDEVYRAINAMPAVPEAVTALNAQPMVAGLNDPQPAPFQPPVAAVPAPFEQPLVASPGLNDAIQQLIPPVPAAPAPAVQPVAPLPTPMQQPAPNYDLPTNLEIVDPNAPPPVPPPFAFSTPPTSQPPQQ